MAPRHELWDGESGNLIWTYRSEADALAQVREFLRDDDPDAIQGLALIVSKLTEAGQLQD